MKKLSEELTREAFKCCGHLGHREELIALAEEWELRVLILEKELELYKSLMIIDL